MNKSYYLVWNTRKRKTENVVEDPVKAVEDSEPYEEVYEIPPDEVRLAAMKHFNGKEYLPSFLEGTGFRKVENLGK